MSCKKLAQAIEMLNEERNEVLKKADEFHSADLYQRAGEMKSIISTIKQFNNCNDCEKENYAEN